MLKFGDKDIPSLFYGSVPVIKAYYGTEQVWPSLPQYVPVQWIETDGLSSYIDTGVAPIYRVGSGTNVVSEVTLDFRLMTLPQASNKVALCGCRFDTATRGIMFVITNNTSSSRNRLNTYRPTVSGANSVIENDMNRHSITMSYPTITMDGVQVTASTAVADLSANFMIGCSGNPSLWPPDPTNLFQPANVRVYGCKIVTEGVTVFDAIPVRIGNEGGLYDKVSGRVIRNSGGGRIMPGPPLEVPYDYEVEYIQRDTSITWKEGGTNVIGGFDLSAYIPQDQTMQDASNCEVTWSFDGTTANVFYGFQYWNTIFASLNMWKGSGVNVYSFTTPASGRTEVVGNLSAFHKQEIKRTGAGQYDLIFDNTYFKDYTTTSTGKLVVAKVMGGSTSSSTEAGDKRFRVMRATFGDNVFLIPVVKGNQMGFYNTLDGQMFLAEQECLSEGKAVGAPYTKEVEYLESTGTQYIDTGVKCSQVYGVSIRYKISSWASYGVVFNSYINESSNATRIITQGSNNGRGWASVNNRAQGSLDIPLSLNTWYNYKANLVSDVLSADINGTSYSRTIYNGNANQNNIRLFGNLSQQISQFTLYDLNGAALIDLIPVRFMNETGQQEGAMYDKVSKQLFRNKGTGSFIIGPDKI